MPPFYLYETLFSLNLTKKNCQEEHHCVLQSSIHSLERTKISYAPLSLMAKEAFNLSAVRESILMLSWIDSSAQETKSFIAPLFFWSLADSYLSWQTIRDLFNFSCTQFKHHCETKEKRLRQLSQFNKLFPASKVVYIRF